MKINRHLWLKTMAVCLFFTFYALKSFLSASRVHFYKKHWKWLNISCGSWRRLQNACWNEWEIKCSLLCLGVLLNMHYGLTCMLIREKVCNKAKNIKWPFIFLLTYAHILESFSVCAECSMTAHTTAGCRMISVSVKLTEMLSMFMVPQCHLTHQTPPSCVSWGVIDIWCL